LLRSAGVDNILDYCPNLTTKSFTKGASDSFAIMEKDMIRISSIILQPYDEEETSIQYWGLDELVISYGDGAYVNDIELDNLQLTMNELSTNDTKYTETEYPGVMINLRNISFELDVKSENILNKKKMVRMFDSSIEYQEDIVIQLGPDNPELVLEAFLKDSAAGITVSAKKEIDGDADNFVYQDKEENTVFKFAPRIVDGTADTYELTIRSLENPSVMMVIYVEVTDTHELAEDLIDQKVEELDTQKEVMDLAAKAKEKEAAEESKKETTEESKQEVTEESKQEVTEESK